jgi:hypothetical protein
MRTLALLACIAGLLAGCGDDSSGPSIPNVAGTYEGTITAGATSEVGAQNLGTFPAAATIAQDTSALIVNILFQENGSLTFSGTVAADGVITLDGDPDVSIPEAAMPQCSFGDAVATNTASLAGDTFVATANVAGASCPWEEAGGDFLPTSFEFRFEGSQIGG